MRPVNSLRKTTSLFRETSLAVSRKRGTSGSTSSIEFLANSALINGERTIVSASLTCSSLSDAAAWFGFRV